MQSEYNQGCPFENVLRGHVLFLFVLSCKIYMYERKAKGHS